MRPRGRPLATTFVLAALVLPGCIVSSVQHEPDRNLVFDLEPFVTNLSFPVSFDFAPDGRVFFNERATGQVRVALDGVLQAEPVAQERVVVDLDTGLIGLALHPDFEAEPWLYVYYTDRNEHGQLEGHVVRHLVEEGRSVQREFVIESLPAARMHSSGQLEFGPDGMLYVAVGDTTDEAFVQAPCAVNGKILRLTPTGERPDDNPLPLCPTYSMGHRNPFGMAFDPRTGILYVTENGPESYDEVNRVDPGKNYGWPITLGTTPTPFLRDPIREYPRIIAPTEAAFYTGDKLPEEFRNNLFFGTWDTRSLHRLVIDPESGNVAKEEVAFDGKAIVDVETGPDGHLYVSGLDGIYRVVPANTTETVTRESP